jgi:hypothetical protein
MVGNADEHVGEPGLRIEAIELSSLPFAPEDRDDLLLVDRRAFISSVPPSGDRTVLKSGGFRGLGHPVCADQELEASGRHGTIGVGSLQVKDAPLPSQICSTFCVVGRAELWATPLRRPSAGPNPQVLPPECCSPAPGAVGARYQSGNTLRGPARRAGDRPGSEPSEQRNSLPH